MFASYNIRFQKVGSVYIAVAVGSDKERFPKLLTFNETGYTIARMLHDGLSEDVIVERLTDIYDTDADIAREYVRKINDYVESAS